MATTPEKEPLDQWERVALELRALRQSHQQAYGNIDNATLGRYLAGEADAGESAQVENALADHPELRLLTDLVRGVLNDLPPVTLDAPPLPMPAPKPRLRPAKRPAPWWRRRSAVAAAACLFLLCGAAMPALGLLSVPDEPNGAALAGPAVARRGSMEVAIADPPREQPAPLRPMAPAAGKGRSRAPVYTARYANPYTETRHAFYLNQRAENLRQEGDYLKAVDSLRRAHEICANRSPSDPAAARTVLNLACTYGDALRERGTKIIALSGHTLPAAAPAITDNKAGLTAAALCDHIDRKSVREVRNEVVPILTAALKVARSPRTRHTIIAALGELGPAASPAVTVLAERLNVTRDPEETTAVLTALQRMGAAAHPALPALKRVIEIGDATKRQGHLAREVVRSLTGREGRIGVHDAAGTFTVATLREANEQVQALADKVEVWIETKRPGTKRRDGEAHRRLASLGPKAVLILIDQEAARVLVTPALKRAGFPDEAIQKALITSLKKNQPDQALLTSLDQIVKNAP